MGKLSATDRAKLPDSAYAYVDSTGKRRLPINDQSHVRNALSRFGQVRFESDEARERSRRKLLNAAKRHGIVPVGFIEGELRTAKAKSTAGKLIIELGRINSSAELQSELRRTLKDPSLTILRWSKSDGTYVDCDGEPTPLPGAGQATVATFLQGRGRPLMAVVHDANVLTKPEITEAVTAAIHLVAGREILDEVDELGVAAGALPEGIVTFLLTDIEGSTSLLHSLGASYAAVLTQVRTHIREAVLESGGRQVEARADEFVAVFEGAVDAVSAAINMQRAMAKHEWPGGHDVRIRVGLHTGEIMLTESGYVGLTVHTAARIMSAAHGGQVLASDTTARLCQSAGNKIEFSSLGSHQLRGLDGEHELVQVGIDDLPQTFPPPAV